MACEFYGWVRQEPSQSHPSLGCCWAEKRHLALLENPRQVLPEKLRWCPRESPMSPVPGISAKIKEKLPYFVWVWDETLTLPRQLYTLQVVLLDHTYPYHPYQRLVDVPEAKWADWFCTHAMRQGQTLTQIIYLQFSWQRTYQSV